MSNNESKENQLSLIYDGVTKPFSRRKFLGVIGAGSALMVTVASCKKNPVTTGGVDLGSGDTGVLN